MLHAVDLGQQLVDHRVVHARAAGARASLLADGVQLVKDDDVEAAVCSQLGKKTQKSTYMHIQYIYGAVCLKVSTKS